MADDRRDPKNKNRKLNDGEDYVYIKDKLYYRYSYFDATGKRQQLYSRTLTPYDKVPKGSRQKPGESLREKEEAAKVEVYQELDSQGGNMTVYQLLQKYVDIVSPNMRETTRKGYRTQLKFMETNALAQTMAKKKIKTVNAMDAEEWMLALHEKEGRSYSSLHTLKGMLRQAFIRAKKSRYVIDNPFDFAMTKKAYGGTKTRDALSRADMRRFLDFVQTDKHFSKYYDGVYILFNTGLRISEFCGLTRDDIDFDEHVIHVKRQLLRVHDGKTNKYYIEAPKTKNGVRDVPMMPDVETAFRNVIANRPEIKETVVWDALHQESMTGFLWLDKDGHYEVAQHWSNHLRWARSKYNNTYKNELPPVTPHVCRHTFCSNCAGAGMSPKTLQMIMGHSSIEFTLNVYTHLEAGDVKKNFFTFMNSGAYEFCGYMRKPDFIAPPTADDDSDEGEVDFDEIPDDDEE